MPIYEPDLSYADMKKAQHTFKCAQCGGIQILAWAAQRNSYMLRCGQAMEHEGVVPLGRDLWSIEVNARLRGGPEIMETTALQKLDPNQMLARVNQSRFPKDLSVPERQLMAKVAIEYGLDPLFGELMIYQGRPYVTIDARRRTAQETGNLDGISARPATKQERTARGVDEKDYLFVAEVWVKGASHAFEGWGTVRAAEAKGSEHLPIVKDPAMMAEKRAEAQALRRAFHMPLPSLEEITEGEFTELSPEKEATKSKSTPTKAQVGSGAPPQNNCLTDPQRKKIWGDAVKMGYSENEIQRMAKGKFQVESINDLTIAQASTLIDLIAQGERPSEPEPEEREE